METKHHFHYILQIFVHFKVTNQHGFTWIDIELNGKTTRNRRKAKRTNQKLETLLMSTLLHLHLVCVENVSSFFFDLFSFQSKKNNWKSNKTMKNVKWPSSGITAKSVSIDLPKMRSENHCNSSRLIDSIDPLCK